MYMYINNHGNNSVLCGSQEPW